MILEVNLGDLASAYQAITDLRARHVAGPLYEGWAVNQAKYSDIQRFLWMLNYWAEQGISLPSTTDVITPLDEPL